VAITSFIELQESSSRFHVLGSC